MPIRNFSQRKSWLVTIASGLIVLLVIGFGLLQTNSSATALTEAQVNATHEKATWIAIAEYAPGKATQQAIQEMTVTFLPTPTWFDRLATDEALDKMLTTSPTPGPTLPPTLFLQRLAGVGRLIISPVATCGYNLKCNPENFWMEKTKDKFITVYAGHTVHSNGSLEAQLSIEWQPLSNPDALPIGGGTFRVPIPAQDVMIVDVIGEQLLLRTDDGTFLVFDVPSQQFISVPASQLTAWSQHQASGGMMVEKGDAPFTRPGFSAANWWSRTNGLGRITVFAGVEDVSRGNVPWGTGVLAVVMSKGEPTAADTLQVYSLPDPVFGALRLFDVKGNQVAVTDEGGGEYFFDLTTRQFFSQFDERANIFTAPLFDPNLPISQATPAPVTPFAPIATLVSNAYP